MSGKIKAKDLTYDSSLPPFLQRLHDRNAGRGDTDRHERPLARPKRNKDPNEDDGPTFVDESGETVGKEEYEKLTKPDANTGDADVGGSEKDEAKNDAAEHVTGGPMEQEVKLSELKATTGLATKKRKAAKIVGDNEDDGAPSGSQVEDGKAVERKAAPKSKPKKKVKPIKLAFDDADDG